MSKVLKKKYLEVIHPNGSDRWTKKAWVQMHEFKRCTYRLRRNICQLDEIDDIYLLAESISSWEKQLDTINKMYTSLRIDYMIYDIEMIAKKVNIETQYEWEKLDLLYKKKSDILQKYVGLIWRCT